MDWSSDVCASDLQRSRVRRPVGGGLDQQGVLALAGTFEQRGRHRGPGSGSGSGYGGADPPTPAYSASSPPSSSPLSPSSSFPAGWTWPPPGPTRTLRAVTQVEIESLWATLLKVIRHTTTHRAKRPPGPA